MNQQAPVPESAFAHPRTFGYAGTVKTELRSMAIVLVPLLLVGGFLIWFLLGAALAIASLDPVVARLIAAAVTLAVMGVLALLRIRQMSTKVRTMSITVDARGITQRDPHATRFLAWNEVTSAEHAADLATVRRRADSLRMGAPRRLASHPLGRSSPSVFSVPV